MVKNIDKLIYEAIEDNVFVGCNFSLVIPNKTNYQNSYGKKAIIPNVEENDINTLYDMASCTKVVATTTALMILLEQGKIRLYDTVKTYVTDFVHDNITIWDLMTHSSGLPADVTRSHFLDKDTLYKHIMNVELLYPKNTRIVYSDIGFILLGFLVEKVSGESLDVFCNKNIFSKLDMKNTCFCPENVKQCAPTELRDHGVDRGYVHDEKAHTLGGVAGHAGLFSTIADVSKFIEMILNDGVYKGTKVLSKNTIDLLFQVQVEEYCGISKEPNRRGLGWIVKGERPCSGDLVSKNTIMHTGFTGTHIVIDRDNKVGFSLLSNRVHPTRENNKIISFRAKLGNYIMAHIDEF